MTDRDHDQSRPTPAPEPAADAPDTAQEATGHDPTPTIADDLKPEQREARAKRIGRRAPVIGGVVAVVAAALLGLIVSARRDFLFEFDEEWAEDVLAVRGPAGDVFSYFMNALGGGIVGVFVVPIAVALALLIFRRPWGALYFIVASAASAGAVQLLKNLFGRARPEDIIVASDFGSFPSGHVANAATIAVALGVIVPHVWVWIWGAVYTLLMAASRTYLGAHWLSDTVGGMLVGAGVALLVWVVFATPLERERLEWTARLAARNAARAQAHITPPAKR
ncbi:phosphatase PAP2 family protein [Agromyces sp. Marseille-P2726]|uniref:phosphatase PAP2 family protein n=1 Tax=Agromyces sp. Marseille-P2726 TaxID=2709132 RepID=UPI00156FCD09|nr:phosphatase PAP2 family protein [Agromyces sp. Marseille-P2726]